MRFDQLSPYSGKRWLTYYDRPELLTVNSNPAFPKTLYEVFNRGVSLSSSKRCLGWRPLDPRTGDFEKTYLWHTYADVDRLRTVVGSGLAQLAKEHGFAADATGDVYALRGPGFASVQGHLESILSRDGMTTLQRLVEHALTPVDA